MAVFTDTPWIKSTGRHSHPGHPFNWQDPIDALPRQISIPGVPHHWEHTKANSTKAITPRTDPDCLPPYQQARRHHKSSWSTPRDGKPLSFLHGSHLIPDHSLWRDWCCHDERRWHLAPMPSDLCSIHWRLSGASPRNVHIQQPMSQMSGTLWWARFIQYISSARLRRSQGRVPPVGWWRTRIPLGLSWGRPEANLPPILGKTPAHQCFCIDHPQYSPSVTARHVQTLGWLAHQGLWLIGNRRTMSIHTTQSSHLDLHQRDIPA